MTVAGRAERQNVDDMMLFAGPGEMRRRCREFDWAATPLGPTALAAAEALVLPQVRARGLEYTPAVVPPELAMRADHEKLQQILLNPLSNAIKFTDRGGEVRVTCGVRGDTVILAVSDSGIGIAPEKLAGIFEPFVQVDQRLSFKGSGFLKGRFKKPDPLKAVRTRDAAAGRR